VNIQGDTEDAQAQVCASCGSDLWTSEFGCPRCGRGRKRVSFDWLVYPNTFLATAMGGVGASYWVGALGNQRGVVIADLALVLSGAAVCMLGTWALRGGAVGLTYGGQNGGQPSGVVSEEGSRANGIGLFAAGLLCIAVGVLVGALA
jgi:hypothetical protein